jgi:hypothetical protein
MNKTGTTGFQCRVECWFRRVTVADGSTVTQDAVVDRMPDEKAAEGVAADQGKEIGSTTYSTSVCVERNDQLPARDCCHHEMESRYSSRPRTAAKGRRRKGEGGGDNPFKVRIHNPRSCDFLGKESFAQHNLYFV